MAVHVVMIARNEMHRHLVKSIECSVMVATLGGGKFIVTDDASDDGTYEAISEHTPYVQQFDEPRFMRHEGQARQAHYEWISKHVIAGDWVLSLDADETVNDAALLVDKVNQADRAGARVVLMPLYEFWDEDPPRYRTDGYWFGTLASRLYRFEGGGAIASREFGCGSEPIYVADHVRGGRALKQRDLHLLHWGYVRNQDRVEKHERYSTRSGGHGHSDRHIQSIVDPHPTLAEYVW